MKKLITIILYASVNAQVAFADSLADIYNIAKNNDPELLQSIAQRNAAFEAIDSSQSALFPQISLSAGYNITTDNNSNKSNNTYLGKVSLTQEVYNYQSWVNLSTAEKTARQADINLAAMQQSLILKVTNAYFGALRSQDNLELIKAEKEFLALQLTQVKERFNTGLSAITDVHNAQAQYDYVAASSITAQNDVLNSYETLREITGIEHSQLATLDTARFNPLMITSDAETLIKESQNKNLRLIAAQINQDIANDNIKLAISGYTPTVHLTSDYTHSHDSSIGKNDEVSLGVNLNMPIFSGGHTMSQVAQAEFNHAAAQENLKKEQRNVAKLIRAEKNNTNAAIATIQAYEQAVVSAQASLVATQAGFKVGTHTIVDVLNANSLLFDANTNLANTRYDYLLSILQVYYATGDLNEQHLMDINAILKTTKTKIDKDHSNS